MNKSKIEWTDMTWNPVTGCTKISEGCKNCYAERIAQRFWNHPFTEVRCHSERLKELDGLRKPRKIFVCSMSDLFHEDVPMEFIGEVFDEMISHPKHTFMVLTKRPARMYQFSEYYGLDDFYADNVWLGVSVENQKAADERIPLLLKTPASVRFVSVEPMLERVDITSYLKLTVAEGCEVLDADQFQLCTIDEIKRSFPKLDWVICGGESGRGARIDPPLIDFRNLKDQCQLTGVPFFLKQMHGVKMPELDGRQWAEYPKESIK